MMQFADLNWRRVHSDSTYQTSQRLKPIGGEQRVYILRWGENEFTVVWVIPGMGEPSYERELDILDVNVRLLTLEEDHRTRPIKPYLLEPF